MPVYYGWSDDRERPPDENRAGPFLLIVVILLAGYVMYHVAAYAFMWNWP